MRKFLKLLVASLFFLAIIGCQKKNDDSVSLKKEATVSQKFSVNDLVNQTNIGNQISFVEKQFSLTPKSKSESGTTYEFEGCEIELTADNKGNVVVISAYVTTPTCSFNTMFGNSKELTIEKLINSDKKNNMASRILVNCVSSCGRTREPEYLYLSPGAAVNGNIATVLSSVNVSGSDDWINKVKSILKIDNLDDDEPINCTDKFDKLAMNYLKGGDISSISISAPNVKFWNEFPVNCKK